MRKFKYLLLLIISIFLTACSGNQIDIESAENTAEYINRELGYDDKVEARDYDEDNRVHTKFHLNDDFYVTENEDDSVREIVFRNVEEEEIDMILELIDFPRTETVNRIVDDYNSTEYESDIDNLVNTEAGFIIYEDVGLFITGDYAVRHSNWTSDTAPYDLIFVYDEDNFEDWIDIEKSYNDK